MVYRKTLKNKLEYEEENLLKTLGLKIQLDILVDLTLQLIQTHCRSRLEFRNISTSVYNNTRTLEFVTRLSLYYIFLSSHTTYTIVYRYITIYIYTQCFIISTYP